MEEGKELVTITPNEIDQLDREYVDYSKNAHRDLTYESDYQAALRVPAAYLRKPSNFEQSFDKILFHLDEAYRKSTDTNTKIMVSRTTDDIFHKVICIIQAKIDLVSKENSRTFFQKVRDSISNFFDNVKNNLHLEEPSAIIAASAAPEVGKLSVAFFDYLLTKWEIQNEESYFYNQLANVYQKILDSKSFSNEFGLIRNTFTTNKDNILTYVVLQKGLTAAKNLMKYDEKDSERQDSARIIMRTLIAMQEWEKGANFLHEINASGLANYSELKDEFIGEYKQFLVYLKSKEGKKDPAKEISKKYPTADSIEYLMTADKNGYNKYMSVRKIKKLAIIFSIVFAIVAFFIWAGIEGGKMEQEKKQYLTDNASKIQDQWSQIEKTVANVDRLIAEKNFKEAIPLINTGIVFHDPSGKADNYTSKADEIKHNKLLKSVDGILTEINIYVSKDMNDEIYQNITETLIPLYNATISSFEEEQMESYKEKLDPLLNKIDKTRDTFLTQRENTVISLIKSKKYIDAKNQIEKLTHKSDKRRGPLYLSKYNEYWTDKRAEYKKELPSME